MKKIFIKISKISLILVLLVILAGSFVRMTGSGMGCPDWPKCFGHLIPPTSISQIEWSPKKNYNKGVILKHDGKLIVSKKKFVSKNKINLSNWKDYTKHDYSDFDATKTWIEFINRLLGVIAGLATLIMFFISLTYWNKKNILIFNSFLIIVGMGFQAWLGKLVVDSNLAPYKITVHMLMALVIISLIIYSIFKAKNHKESKIINVDSTNEFNLSIKIESVVNSSFKYGIFTFDDDAKTSYDKMIEAVSLAENFLEENAYYEVKNIEPKEFDIEKLQKQISKEKGFEIVCKINQSPLALYYSSLNKENITKGVLTPEHIIRTKRLPLVLDDDSIEESLKKYKVTYKEYFDAHANDEIMLNPAPNYAVVKDFGVITFGKNEKEANILNDVVSHTMNAVLTADKLGGYESISLADSFEME